LGSITVNANVAGRPTGTVANEIKIKAAKIKLPEGIAVEYLGDVKNQADAFGSLGLALIIAIVLVYLIMVALYESVIYPFVVLFSIPVALIGRLAGPGAGHGNAEYLFYHRFDHAIGPGV